MFQNADEIFDDINQCLIQMPVKVCDSNAVNDTIKRYVKLCILFDGLFSTDRTPSREATDDICELVEIYVN